MERLTRFRSNIILGFVCVMIFFFSFKLYDLQINQVDGTVDNTKTYTTYTTVKAARGEILDRFGNVLVSNRASYDMIFNHYVICSAPNRNAVLLELVQLCREHDIEYTDNLPVTENAPFSYTFGEISSAWQGYFQAYLREKPELDSDISAQLLMKKLRDYYNIPIEWSDADARAVIGIRYELDLRLGVTNLPSYVFLKDADSKALAAILELNVPGLKPEATVVRVYNTQYASHILGYVGPMDNKQWQQYKDLTYEYKKEDGSIGTRPLYNMDAQVGQSGLEEAYEAYLHGIDGTRVDITATDGTVIRSYYTVEPQAGQNVELSIDLHLQASAEDNLAALIERLRAEGADGADAEGGAVVVMDVKTGQILASASYPTYDLSTFREDYNKLLETDFAPLFNRALQGEYPPGSTYNLSMVVAGINANVVNRHTEIFDSGVYLEYADSGFKPECLLYTNNGYGHGNMNAMDALRDSCNYYFYHLADRMDIEDMDMTAAGLGLGESTGVELAEKLGIRANPANKQKLYTGDSARWYIADQITASIGQSINKFTPLQLCVYTTTLANRGTRYQATFLSRVLTSDYSSVIFENEKKVLSQMQISDEAYAAYTEGMRLVAQSGTASRFFKNYPIAVAAKTGTAQHSGGTEDSDHGAFVCYAPYDDPEIAVVVYVEKGGHGSTVAEIGKKVLDTYFADILAGDLDIGENQIG